MNYQIIVMKDEYYSFILNLKNGEIITEMSRMDGFRSMAEAKEQAYKLIPADADYEIIYGEAS